MPFPHSQFVYYNRRLPRRSESECRGKGFQIYSQNKKCPEGYGNNPQGVLVFNRLCCIGTTGAFNISKHILA